MAELLRSPAIAGVSSLGRRSLADAPASPKPTQQVVDLEDAAGDAPLLAGHDAASCTLEVGQPTQASRETLGSIDVDDVTGFATACHDQGVESFARLVAVGADDLKMKGELEAKVIARGFFGTGLVRPSILLTPQDRYGVGPAILLKVWPRPEWLLAGRCGGYVGSRWPISAGRWRATRSATTRASTCTTGTSSRRWPARRRRGVSAAAACMGLHDSSDML